MARSQVSFCSTIDEELTELENICGVKTYLAKQAKYNSFIQKRSNKVNIAIPALTSNIQGFFWFITVLDTNESLRYLKYISDVDETSRYNLGAAFAPSHKDGHLRGLCATVLEFNQTYRWIDLNQNSALAITRLRDQIADLK
ncbi:9171_t:CDS:2 [Racocetra persica]|uniref:9171_t:CDS:1 n=1 Tax=Racocetra persica TaxID=160502 RepID=A0ACA9KGI8_9GLOM|nr:9171_t:CDS:2 [Racocetra persica]